jgi:hypothetical protein
MFCAKKSFPAQFLFLLIDIIREVSMPVKKASFSSAVVLAGLLILSGSGGWCDDPQESRPGVYIDSIIIDNNNIFNPDSAKYDFWFYRLANRLHIKTRKFVIARELLQKRGDIFSRKLADETERNLRTLSFIWDARVELYRSGDGLNVMKVSTSDTWTILGGFSLSRKAGETVYHLRFEELNLLGLGQSVSMHYYIREFDADYGEFSFLERRLFGTRLYLNVYYDENPEVGLKGVSIGKPFYSLDSRVACNFYISTLERRKDYYGGGQVIASETQSGDQFIGAALYRFGTYHNKITTGINVVYKDIRISDKTLLDVNETVSFSNDSLFFEIGPEFGIDNIEYVKTTRINNFRAMEDIALRKGCRLKPGRTFDASTHDKLFDRISLDCSYSAYVKSNLFIVSMVWEHWFDGPVDFRKRRSLSIRYYNNHISWLTPLASISYDEDLWQRPMATLYLGENNGLRGFPKNFATGEKRLLINIENRFFTGVEILSTDLGAVQFVDMGQTWPREEEVDLGELLWSIGFGLRIGAEKISNARTMRVDIAYAGEFKDWQVSFGLGQYIR